MKIEWIMDSVLPVDTLRRMEHAASQCPVCEGIHVPCAVSVRLCSDETIAEINTVHRGIPRPTDVLSFPSVSYPPGLTAGACEQLLRREYDDELCACFLGDIVISVPHILSQADEFGHSVDREACYLLVHGICHLMGYDHMNDNEKKVMRKMEETILASV